LLLGKYVGFVDEFKKLNTQFLYITKTKEWSSMLDDFL
jgi:hypothetical protein